MLEEKYKGDDKMICPNCGYESSGNYCSNCGAPLGRDGDEVLSEDFCSFDMFERAISEDEYWENGAVAERNSDSGGEEKRKSRPKPEKPGKEKESASRGSNTKESGKEKREQKKEQRKEQKEQKKDQKTEQKEQKIEQKDRRKREERMKSLENEVQQLRNSQEAAPQKRKRRSDREYEPDRGEEGSREYEESGAYENRHQRFGRSGRSAEYGRNSVREIPDRSRPDSAGNGFPDGNGLRAGKDSSSGNDFGEAVAKGAVGVVVLLSRLMQFASAILMACMVLAMAQSFWIHGQNLGDIRLLGAERNYGLAFYVSFAGVTLFMGLIWCLWILSRKGAGGGIRMKKYDTGRGFLPFLICITAVLTTGLAASRISIEPEAFRGVGIGIKAALEAVNTQWEILLFASTAGAVLSMIRKIMRV